MRVARAPDRFGERRFERGKIGVHRGLRREDVDFKWYKKPFIQHGYIASETVAKNHKDGNTERIKH